MDKKKKAEHKVRSYCVLKQNRYAMLNDYVYAE
jgi:hypothetical protein